MCPFLRKGFILAGSFFRKFSRGVFGLIRDYRFHLFLGILVILLPVVESFILNQKISVFGWSSVVVGFVLLIGSSITSKESELKFQKVESRISRFKIDVKIIFSWPVGNNPLLDNGNDSGRPVEELFWLEGQNARIKLYSIEGYKIIRNGPNTAEFSASLSPLAGADPVGQSTSFLSTLKNASAFVILKNYLTNGRDFYSLTVDHCILSVAVNNKMFSFEQRESRKITPYRAGDTIWGLLEVPCAFEIDFFK